MNARQASKLTPCRAALFPLLVGWAFVAPSAAAPPPQAASPQALAAVEPADPAARQDAERLAVWNSPQMLVARAWLQDYFRSSRRYTDAEARRYVARVEQLDADAMRIWLADLQQRMDRVAEQRQSSLSTRQYRAARASAVQQQRAINLAKLQAAQSGRARIAQSQVDAQRRFGQAVFLSRAASREETLRTQIATQNFRTLQILSLLDRQELRSDLRALGR